MTIEKDFRLKEATGSVFELSLDATSQHDVGGCCVHAITYLSFREEWLSIWSVNHFRTVKSTILVRWGVRWVFVPILVRFSVNNT